MTMKAVEHIKLVLDLVAGPRDHTHGSKDKNFGNIAALWDAYAQRRWGLEPGSVDPTDVAELMVLLKVARTMTGAHNLDDYHDQIGYAGIAAELAESDRQGGVPDTPGWPDSEMMRGFVDPLRVIHTPECARLNSVVSPPPPCDCGADMPFEEGGTVAYEGSK